MILEIHVLEHNSTWESVPLPLGKKPVGSLRAYAIKVGLNGEVDCLKALLVPNDTLKSKGLIIVKLFLQWPK